MTEQATIEPNTAASAPPAPAAVVQPPAPPAAPSGTEPAASATAAASGTLIDAATTDDAADKPVAIPADWPADWRDKMAGDDKQFRKQLDRYGSPLDVGKKIRNLEQRLSSGEVKKPLPDNPTEKELADWRKENGVPEKPEEYKIEPPKGFVFGDADKPMLDTFTAHAHKNNWPPKQLNEAVAWYVEQQEQLVARRQEQDAMTRQASEDELRREWGNDYRPNINSIKNLFATAPEGVMSRFMSARLEDGRLLGNDAMSLMYLAGLAREINPVATLLPNTGGNPMRGIADRKADLQKLMGNRNSDYWRGPKAEMMQQEYRDLVEAEEKLKARAA